MYEQLLERLTPKIRIWTGIVLLVAAFIRQQFSEKALDMYAYYIGLAAVLCFAHILVCRIAKAEADVILFVVLNLAVVITGFALSGSEYITGAVRYGMWGICAAADWVINAVLIQCKDVLKKIVMGFVITLITIFLAAILFVGPVLIYAFL